jgi:hypothetical protein
MSERIDRFLEGNLDRDALETSERIEADGAARALNATRSFIDERAAPDVTAAVMQRLEQLVPPASSAREGFFPMVVRVLWTPRQVAIRPAYGVLVTAAFIFLVSLAPFIRTQRGFAETGADTATRLLVQFRLEADATNVQLAGSFTNWEPAYQLNQIAPRAWTITVSLPQGVHDYAFIVDGKQWVSDPYAPSISDGFGGRTSRLTLLSPDASRL